MLGKLFNLGSGSISPNSQQQTSSGSSKPVLSLDSVQEDLHTRTLLFPDPQTLQQCRNEQLFPFTSLSAPISAVPIQPFDYNPDICIDDHDVRVIVMQDGMGASVSSSLLFDSHPFVTPVSPPSSATTERPNIPESWKISAQSRRSSVPHASAAAGARAMPFESSQPQPRSGAFDRRSSTNGRFPSAIETESQKAGREYREEMATFMSCIFGNSEMLSYKGTSTKVHLYNADQRGSDLSSSALGTDAKSSTGRSSTRSRLAQSYSSDVMSPGFPPALSYGTSTTASSNTRSNDSKRVLITRLFPVVVPTDSIPANQAPEDPVFKRPQQRPKRTPMYAVVLVVNLQSFSALANKANFRGSGSFTENESLPSSYGSGRPMAWNTPGSTAPESVDFYIPESDDRLEHITQHWDIIMRTLTQLQSVFATSISNMLKQIDMSIPDISTPCPSHRVPPINPKANSKMLALPPHCFCNDRGLAKQVDVARNRIVSGLQAERVCTGQGRWSTWRDEARVISRLQLAPGVNGREFFYRVLTGFLGTHTQWLQALGPDLYRQRHFEREKLKNDEDLLNPARTIIIGKDKMAARRLIFLLSAFLPAKENICNSQSLRPVTSASFNFSASPPGFATSTLGREKPLRKKMTRRSGKNRIPSHNRTPSQSTHTPFVSSTLAHLTLDGSQPQGRHESDDLSSRPAPPPSLHGISSQSHGNSVAPEKNFRKSSIAASTTAMPEPAVAHFATLHRHENLRAHRPGSSSSIAADDLKRSLHRSESMSNGSDSMAGSSRWGYFMGGFWSGTVRRESVTSVTQSHLSSPIRGATAAGGPSGGGPRADPLSPRKSTDKRQERIAKLGFSSEQLSSVAALQVPIPDPEPSPRHVTTPPEQRNARTNTGLKSAAEIQPRQPIDMPHPFGSPVKTSINPKDGVIDVDIPFTDFLASFETAVSSPSSSGYMSTPGISHDGFASFEQSCRLSSDADTPLNVAGWLQSFHPDFILQAVPPHERLMDQIQEALRNEPSPACLVPPYALNSESPTERWVDVSSALIADMTKGTISRIRYRRLIVPRERPMPSRPGKGGPYGSTTVVTPCIEPYEIRHNEQFEVERIGTVEDILTDAIDRVVAQPGDLTSVSSMSDIASAKSIVGSLKTQPNSRLEPEAPIIVSSSMPPPSSIFPSLLPSISMPAPSLRPSAPRDVPTPAHQQPSREVSRGECKAVVLSSLANLVRDVLDKRDMMAVDDVEDPNAYVDDSVMRHAIRLWLHAAESAVENSPPGVPPMRRW
ncbi:hypothetical protein BROUX41_005994 [Berkeleyomyces rouxiae]|uniref:uncharacterized protein n=1 Tax=Berkeleyomyces rouxiae TaxID=2035830 RepID=UPI003B7A8108